MNGASRFGAGFLVGVIVSVVLAARLDGGEPAATTVATTAAPVSVTSIEPWFERGEAIIGGTAVLPGSLEVTDGVAVYEFDLAGLGPSLSADDRSAELAMPAGDILDLPEEWQLTTVSGTTVAATTDPTDSSVSFELPAPDDEVASIAITGWRVLVPAGDSVTVPLEEGASGELRRGTVTVSAVLEQSISTIVHVDFDGGDDPWQSWVDLRPRDPNWRVSGRQSGLQLTWEGDNAPGSIVIDDVGYELSPVTGSVPVYEAAVTP